MSMVGIRRATQLIAQARALISEHVRETPATPLTELVDSLELCDCISTSCGMHELHVGMVGTVVIPAAPPARAAKLL